jgi:hypothetical protein
MAAKIKKNSFPGGKGGGGVELISTTAKNLILYRIYLIFLVFFTYYCFMLRALCPLRQGEAV